MAMRPTSAIWNIFYGILLVLIIAALLQLIGVFTLSSAIATVLYTLVVVFVVLTVVHLLGAI